MPRFRGVALQGSSRGFLPPLLLFALLIFKSGLPAEAADDETACRSPFARIVSIQGSIELLRAGQNNWSKVSRLDTSLCDGDKLRTGARSRAALFIQPETLVRVDQNTSISVSQSAEETLVEFTQEELVATATAAHTCGAGYFITRFPRKFRVNTPHLNAAVEGTEFLVAMRCEATDLSVFEGKVLAASAGANVFPSQSVVSGRTLTVGGSEPPVIKLHLKPADAVQWTLYYPPITPAGIEPAEDCRVVPQDNRVSCLIARAEQLLRTGRVDEAQANIGDALTAAPYSSDAKALSSIISLVRNEKAEALRLAKEAVDASTSSAPAWLALSYAQQADFKLEAALTSAQRASELTPTSALAFARVAELQLSLGWTREAEKTAKQAVAANPSESRAHMILGFVHLAQINVKQAREDFERSIELDSTDPLSRLGLGLAIIRKGNLVEGRAQIEIAVSLDPTNSLIRSYVGKAYYEENSKERDQLASIQFELAKEIDPKDPTPWFYDAIRNQVANKPREALYDLQKSIDLNNSRAVYRSRLLVDQDSGARSASLARIYNSLGFAEVARIEATTSLIADPGNYSAHRFLSDAYSTLPRHDIVRASELLQAQLRQPLGSPPLQTQLANDFLFGLTSYGPTSAGLYEFNPLFTRDKLNLQVFGLKGDEHTYGDQVIVNGLGDNASFSLSQFRSYTDGFRPNNDLSQRFYDGFVQFRADESTSVQFETVTTDQESGDLTTRFDPTFFSKSRRDTQNDTFRLGLRHQLYPNSDFLVSASWQNRRSSVLSSSGEGITVKNESSKLEVQHWVQPGVWSVISGISYFEANTEENVFGDILLSDPSHTNAYAYGYASLFEGKFVLQPGLGYDHLFSRDAGEQLQLNPKFGVVWSPQSGTTLRAALFRVLKRRINADAGLEPTQIAGFAQFFDDLNGTDSHFVGAAWDQRISRDLYFGLEFGRRRLSIPLTNEDFSVEYFQWYERLAKSYVNWMPDKWLSLTLGVSQEIYDRPEDDPGSEAFTRAKTVQVPLSVRLFSGSGLSASVTTTYLTQGGRFINADGDFFEGSERSWIIDLAAYYYFPRRSGLIGVEARNLFNQHFRYQAIDSSVPRFAFEQILLFRIALNF